MDKSDKVATIARLGNGRHAAGRAYELRIDGTYAGVFEKRSQAVEYAEAQGAKVVPA